MNDDPLSHLPEPGSSLEAPATYLYDGPASSRGRRINAFCLSLRWPDARRQFLRDAAHGIRPLTRSFEQPSARPASGADALATTRDYGHIFWL